MSEIFTLSFYAFSPWVVPPLITAIGIILLGCIVIIRLEGSPVSTAFSLLVLSTSLTLCAYGLMASSTVMPAALWWARAALTGNILLSLSTYLFIRASLKLYRHRWLIWWGGFQAFGLILAVFLGNALIRGVSLTPWGFFPRLGWLAAAHFSYLAMLAIIGFREYWNHSQAAETGSHRRLLHGHMLAFGIGILAIIDYAAMLNVMIYPIGYLPVLVCLALNGRLILRARGAGLMPHITAEQIISTMNDPLLILDGEGTIRLVNQTTCSVFGYIHEELLGEPLTRLLDNNSDGTGQAAELLYTSSARNLETRFRTKTGQTIDVSLSLARLMDQRRFRNGMLVIAKDNRERKRANDILSKAHDQLEKRVQERTAELIQANENLQQEIAYRRQVELALRESDERYALATRGANDGLWDWDLRSNRIYYSPRWKSMLLYEDHEVSDDPDEWFRRVHPDDLEQLKIDMGAHLKGLSPHFESEHRILHKDGTYRWVLTRGIAVRGVGGLSYRMAGSQTDITDRKRAEEQLLHDAFHDALTGLPNRALFMDRLGRVIERVKRSKDQRFSVLFLDLDRFKLVNDSLGHTTGDRLLTALARRLESCLRTADTVARLGGDEFVILLEDVEDLDEATLIAERVQQSLQKPFVVDNHEVYITASIGIVSSDTGYDRPEDVLRDADIAMYGAKAHGKARHALFDTTMRTRAVTLLKVETDLRRALERQELRVHYQPIIDLGTGNLAGFEALARWAHPDRGLIPPAEFIPVAEETGLISAISQWVTNTACTQMKAWQEQFVKAEGLTIGVNISSRQFIQPDLLRQVRGILEETGLEATCLSLEITETAIIENLDAAQEMLSQLHSLGVHVQMDDFGTGYSSLSYLHRFPIDAIKIDRSFISELGLNGNPSGIVNTIVNLANDMGIEVIAEGVETEQQLAILQGLGCRYAQGFLFSRPLKSEDALEYLRQAMAAREAKPVTGTAY